MRGVRANGVGRGEIKVAESTAQAGRGRATAHVDMSCLPARMNTTVRSTCPRHQRRRLKELFEHLFDVAQNSSPTTGGGAGSAR